MFSFLSSDRAKRFLYVGLVLLVMAAVIVGCDSGSDEDADLNGLWVSDFDGYVINTKADKIYYLDNFSADIVNAPDYSATSGVLIIEFTSYYEIEYDEDWEVVSEGWIEDNNGKFGAVYWIELTADSVKMANAYDTETWEHSMYDTKSEAEAAFTPYQDKSGDFVSQWGTYTN
jgi:hypothetical protein